MFAIEVTNITKQYGTKLAVNNVDLRVKKGELYGFLGRNGAGKSTFINMLTGIIHPTTGTVRLLGSPEQNEILDAIGVLPDYTAFYDSMTAMQHVRYFARLQGKKLSKNDCLQLLDAVGLRQHAHQKVGRFSFGMKKKLGIAQAIAPKPQLLILDEPTSGLDPESSIMIQQLLVQLHEQGTTVFMTSHNLAEIEKICTKIAIMKDGRIVSEGALASLQEQFNDILHVSMKISITLPPTLRAVIEEFVEHVVIRGQWIEFQAEREEQIGDVVTALVRGGIAVHRINANEPNLEDIFLAQ